MCTFLSEHRSSHATVFKDTNWIAKLCNLGDIFSKLNVCLQGKDTSILNLYNKVGGFLKKAELWKRASAEGDFTCFPQVDAFLSSEDVEIAPVKSIIEAHLANLIGAFHFYSPDMEQKSIQLDWARNPFLFSEARRRKLSVSHQEKLFRFVI